MKVLVIGSSGYMGRHLMVGLSDASIEAQGVSSADGSGIEPQSGLLPKTFAISPDTTTVVYMAQSPHFRDVPEKAAHVMTVNTLSAVQTATLARAAGVQRFIYVSTGTVYDSTFAPIAENASVRRDNWYALSKLHSEEALGLFRQDMEIVVVRPFGVYGPAQTGRLVPNLIDAVQNGRSITLQPKKETPTDNDGLRISLCYIDDATAILVKLIENGGVEYLNLAGDKAVSIRTIAETAGAILGRSPNFEISSSARDTDLIADTQYLINTMKPQFTSLKDGIERMIHFNNEQ